MNQLRDTRRNRKRSAPRRAAVLVLFAVLLPVLLAMMAFAVDMGYLVLTRTQLQCAADSAAMAGASHLADTKNEIYEEAKKYAAFYRSGGKPVPLSIDDVEIGIWDATNRKFTPSNGSGNAVRVTTRRSKKNGNPVDTLFAGILGINTLDTKASAVAMANPRDIAFVVDMSGSMNDDTETCWATDAINSEFKPDGYPTIGNELMEKIYTDFGYGSFPGELEYIGAPWGIVPNQYAYAELTKDDGPLTRSNIPDDIRIKSSDSETTRKKKAYTAIIRYQIARVMPNAKPAPVDANYRYWEKYLDYLIRPQTINSRTGGYSSQVWPAANTGQVFDPDADSGSGDDGSDADSGGDDNADDNGSGDNNGNDNGNDNGNNGNGNNGNGNGNNGNNGNGNGNGNGNDNDNGPWDWFNDWMNGWTSTATASAQQIARVTGANRTDIPTNPEPQRPIADLSRPVAPIAASFDTIQLSFLQFALLGGYGQPPTSRGTLPPNQDSDRITGFNNPNRSSFPSASSTNNWRNWIGYRTYVQFMGDFGRDLQPASGYYTPLSKESSDCPWHSESTAGGSFEFPPRTQAVHAARRALIAGIQVIKERNSGLINTDQADWVTIISFDKLSGGGPKVEQPLDADYKEAMLASTRLQAVGDIGASTATETGLLKAYETIKSKSEGGSGRENTNKVVVLLTDGMPNLYSSSTREIRDLMSQSGSSEFYSSGSYAMNAPLAQVWKMQREGWYVYPVGIGLGTNYDFMDRMARLGGTANDAGQSPRGSGNPADYEKRLAEIFEEIITNPQVRLVQ